MVALRFSTVKALLIAFGGFIFCFHKSLRVLIFQSEASFIEGRFLPTRGANAP
jgi:hypothetical protein